MNNIQIAESNNFPTLFQRYELQLYSIRSRMLHFYDNVKDRDLSTTSEANLTELYGVFSELDELGHLDVDNEMCELILQDPVIQSLLPAIHTSYNNFFSLHEMQLARNILGNENP